MTRARAALLVATAVAGLVSSTWRLAGAEAGAPLHGKVIVFVEDAVSFEEVMAVSQFQSVATVGGAALMATNGNYRDNATSVFQALGSGGHPDGPKQLMAHALATHGIAVCVREGAGLSGYRPPAPMSPLRYLGLGADGQAACREGDGPNPDEVVFLHDHFVSDFAQPNEARNPADLARLRRQALKTEGKAVEGLLGGALSAERILVLVISPMPSADMGARGDEVTPLLMASGTNLRLFDPVHRPHALRSDTTRQAGLVANVDIAPTILDFFGIPIPAEMDGQPIELTDEPAPFRLHRLHLEQRRIRFPIQLAEVAFVSGAGAVAIVALLLVARRRLPPRLTGPLRVMALCGVSFPIPLMLGGLLPRLTYWVAVPFVVLSVLALAALAWTARWPGPLGPFTFLGLIGLAVVIVDAVLGWRGARIPLLGGTMFDGARFYGLPNAFLCLLLASALFVAAALPAFPGFLVLIGAGLFAGFPSLGADVGGAITMFFAAGLWWVLRTRRRFRIKELAFVAGVTALGLGAVLLANRYLPGMPTHATRFVERTGSNLGDALHEFGDRLSVSFEQVRQAPPALIPLIGIPIILALVLTRPGPIGWGLDLAGKRWKHALVVLTLAGAVAFFANDTGVAAAAPVFLYAMSGMAYPAFLAAADRLRGANGGPREGRYGHR